MCTNCSVQLKILSADSDCECYSVVFVWFLLKLQILCGVLLKLQILFLGIINVQITFKIIRCNWFLIVLLLSHLCVSVLYKVYNTHAFIFT